MKTMTQAAKSRTMIFATLLAVTGALQANLPILQEMLEPKEYGYVTIGIAVIVAVLRALTNEPLTNK